MTVVLVVWLTVVVLALWTAAWWRFVARPVDRWLVRRRDRAVARLLQRQAGERL